MGYPVMTNDRDNDRRLAYAFWHNDRRMIRLMMCAPGAEFVVGTRIVKSKTNENENTTFEISNSSQ